MIYRGRHLGPTQNLMCFGFECGDGWFQIIFDLSASIEDIALQLKDEGVPEERLPAVSQVKEKFGGLRFYVNNLYGEMDKLIDEAEALSEKTCDVCGGPAKVNYKNGWFRTVCHQCNSESD